MGRWICDFRPLNAVTKKRPTPIGDVFAKTRLLAGRRWKSGLDAWSGFNQMRASERAQRLLQIITSKGVRQWTVLPFGVTNGPPYFQEMMLDLYGGHSNKLPSLLANSMVEQEAYLDIFIDDIQFGTGDALDTEAWLVDQAETNETDGFTQHLDALARILERARTAKLRFKLDKCYFCQWSIETLGMTVGCGVLQASPKKTKAITAWPRPSRLEDVERFLATTVFIREHLSPRYSEIAKPLRDLLSQLQEDRKSGRKRSRAKFTPTAPAAPDNNWATFWKEPHEEAFKKLKTLVTTAVELHVPDMEGARLKTNPFHLWVDACAYGIGAGLFQGPPVTSEPNTVDTK